MKMIPASSRNGLHRDSTNKRSCLKRKTVAKRSRKVAFTETVQIRKVDNREQLDKDMLWYKSESYENYFRNSLLVSCEGSDDIVIYFSACETQGKTVDVRGLEDESRRLHVAETVDAILDVQVHQWSSGIRDPDQLAEVSQRYSKYSQVQAIHRACE